jgi:hypothetical protein
MKYLFIFFFGILNKICLINSFLLDECLKFDNAKEDEGNFCWSHSYSSAIEIKKHGIHCLKCQIKDTNAITRNTCGKTLQCISFIFYNNSFFEEFFLKYPDIINHILKDPSKEKVQNKLIITFQNYNLTEISFKYLNSILNINSSSYHILHVIFIRPISNPILTHVKNDFSHIPINAIYLAFSCKYRMDDDQWSEYVIKPRTNLRQTKYCPITQLESTTTKNM